MERDLERGQRDDLDEGGREYGGGLTGTDVGPGDEIDAGTSEGDYLYGEGGGEHGGGMRRTGSDLGGERGFEEQEEHL